LLLDDVGIGTLDWMNQDGVEPALVVETSPTNFQAWVRVSDRPLPEGEATQIARELARRYGADPNSADCRHFGRLAGFTNPKPQYVRGNGQFPFVLLREAKGTLASQAARLREEARQLIGQKPRQGGGGEVLVLSGTDRDPIEVFQELTAQLLETYGQAADCSRVDWMVTSEMLHRGFAAERIKAAMREASPKLHKRKKGHVDDYINRSVDKAFEQFRHSAQGDRNMTDKAWEKKRKARTHQLIQVGGLADIAGLIDTDPGALLGGLLLIADALRDEPTFRAYKRHGDAMLQQRAQARKANKKGRS
jgi:hypothetical protein